VEPRLRFARTRDNVALAYWTHGQGPPLVHMPWLPWSHVQLECQNSEMGRWFEIVGRGHTLVRYDGRGTGLSDRNDPDFSVDAQVSDLECVVDALGLERFLLLGVFNTGPAAVQYAVRHADRLSGLILWCTYARGEDYYASDRVKSIRELLGDWELYTETGAHTFVGWPQSEAGHEVAALMRESSSPELTLQFFDAMRDVDCSELLPQVTTPTLVLHPREFPLIDAELARQIALGIEDARLVYVNGNSLAPTRADTETIVRTLDEFEAQIHQDAASPAQPVAPTSSRPTRPHGLTTRELDVLQRLSLGRSNQQIAEDLVVSRRTVERHVENIFAKIGVHNRAQATAFAVSNGLVNLDLEEP
jgi:pimeloyl-ACP methyl ester carboxylesterase/DNA-binding CsgD family transcriptional regulator